MRYLRSLFGNNNFGQSENTARNMAEQGAAQAQQAAQMARQNEAQMKQAEAMSKQAEAQQQAEEAKRRQSIMQLGMMIAGGFGGGGGEAAAGGAGDAAVEEIAKESAEKAMAEIAPQQFLENQVANPESFLFDPTKALENGASFQDLVRPTRGGLLGNVGWSNSLRW